MTLLEEWNATSNLAKATKAEGVTAWLRNTPLSPEAKQQLEYASWILSEVRHAAQCANQGLNRDEILKRVWSNMLAPKVP